MGRKRKKMTYFNVNFPKEYNDTNIYLRDIIAEEAGTKLCMALMRTVLDIQIENAEPLDIKIMSQVYFPIKINDVGVVSRSSIKEANSWRIAKAKSEMGPGLGRADVGNPQR